ncbi:phage tail tape measure protein [Shinella sp. CPCC 101442]|uniref:phage tail tape measure protein n=1 Tax=Shinella sp. CPCC 101442 TaxID=2932265 RepID=UPI002152C71E|nr:phage tail tape measure protein [Shinella sp. CPCC 101442]MCR6498902.1 phage tail tape measure protein [Shinella sp. CPCC 101442]
MVDDTSLNGTKQTAEQLSTVFDDLEARSRSFGSALTAALRGAVVDGKGLEGVLTGLARRMSDIALSVGLKPLEGMFSSGVSNLLGGVTPFAKGGVVAAPTYFGGNGGSGGLGLMGEAGAEAILPLKRGPDGALGVATEGGGGARIVFNVTAQDAASFRKSEGQIAAMLTRAVGRGQRSL